MKEKKQSANWYIAATHYLTSGFAVPFVMGLFLGIPVAFVIGKENILLGVIVSSMIWFLGTWLGVIYSAKYLAKTYIIKDSNKIIKLSTIYLAVLGGLYRLDKIDKGITTAYIVDIILFAVIVFIFYYSSKKYIHNTEVAEVNPGEPAPAQ